MNFLEQLQDNKGGLIRLKSQLCWYEGAGWDGREGRICLLLDAAPTAAVATAWGATRTAEAAAYLLVDGAPHWVWVTEVDVEFL